MGWRIEKRFGGDAEVDVEVAGDHRSRIVVALSTDFPQNVIWTKFYCNPFSEFFNSIDPQETCCFEREPPSLSIASTKKGRAHKPTPTDEVVVFARTVLQVISNVMRLAAHPSISAKQVVQVRALP